MAMNKLIADLHPKKTRRPFRLRAMSTSTNASATSARQMTDAPENDEPEADAVGA
jgi:hypothetical protein